MKKLAYKIFFNFFKKADIIIVVSKAIKTEIHSYFSHLKVRVIYNTINLKLFRQISKKDLNVVKKNINYHLDS